MRVDVLVLLVAMGACSGSSSKGDTGVDASPTDAFTFEVDAGPDDALSTDAPPRRDADVTHEPAPELAEPGSDAAEPSPDVTHEATPDAATELPHDATAAEVDVPEATADEVDAPDATPVGPWTQCASDAECQAVLGAAGYCNLAFPGGQCQGCDPYDLGTEKCTLLGKDGLTLTCREMAPTVCLFDCPCPAWLRCLESEQLCILQTCAADAECVPFVCRPISEGGTSYCLPND
jgi:hypothetical protein